MIERLTEADYSPLSLRVIDGFAARYPTVMCLHDLHWADPSTLELLRQLPGQLTTPTLVIVSHRPTPDLNLPGDRLIVGALDHNEVGALLAARLGGTASSSLLSFVATKAGSNAFFVEELASHLAESGALRRSVVDDAWELASEADRDSIPPTVRAVLAARLDGLDDPPRRVAREASVVGRDFLYRILAEIAALLAELGPSLRSLEDAGLVRGTRPLTKLSTCSNMRSRERSPMKPSSAANEVGFIGLSLRRLNGSSRRSFQRCLSCWPTTGVSPGMWSGRSAT
ncbi:MAG: hypothetical protein ACJ72Y_07715 [Actinomycetes bacterium]